MTGARVPSSLTSPAGRAPRPKPLVAMLMAVAFFGGSCTIQEVLGPSREPPSQQEVTQMLGAAETPPTEAGARLVAASMALMTEKTHVAERYHPYAMVFGFVLVTLYSFTFVFGLRAFALDPRALKPLSTVAVLVLPFRVAMAAVDLASTRALEPATRSMVAAFAEVNTSRLPQEEAAAVAHSVTETAPLVMMASQLVAALLVCLLFHYAWRYFQRPEVIAFFERQAGGKSAATDD